jgi:hypothetical protein
MPLAPSPYRDQLKPAPNLTAMGLPLLGLPQRPGTEALIGMPSRPGGESPRLFKMPVSQTSRQPFHEGVILKPPACISCLESAEDARSEFGENPGQRLREAV